MNKADLKREKHLKPAKNTMDEEHESVLDEQKRFQKILIENKLMVAKCRDKRVKVNAKKSVFWKRAVFGF